MKAWIKVEDPTELKRISHVDDLCSVLWEFDQYLRSKIKHDDRDELQEVRDRLHEEMQDNGINLDELYT